MFIRPEVKTAVTSINELTGAPLEPENARIKFSTVCGVVARDRVSLLLPSWKEMPDCLRVRIRNEILDYFSIPVDLVPFV